MKSLHLSLAAAAALLFPTFANSGIIITADSASASSAASNDGFASSSTVDGPHTVNGGGLNPNLSTSSSAVNTSWNSANNNSSATLTLSAPGLGGTQDLAASVSTSGSAGGGFFNSGFGDEFAPASSSGNASLSGTFVLDSAYFYALTGTNSGGTFSIDGVGGLGSSGVLLPGTYNFSASVSGSASGDVSAATYGSFANFDLSLTPSVPEPASITLIGTGLLAAAGYGWRRRNQSAAI